MTASDAERWDQRYADRDLPEPSPPDALVAAGLVDLVPVSGLALDVACGLGAQSVWLALRGLSVTAVDVSDVAVDATQRLAVAVGVEALVDARRVDLDVGLASDGSDFDVVICQRFRAVELYPELVACLRVGGVLVLTVLSEVGAESPGPFHAPAGELVDVFADLPIDVIHRVEADGQASLVARRS